MTATAETPHPRDVFDYKDGSGAEQAFLDAQARGRLPHAWLLCGPEGVGKATFAYRAARRLLGAAPDPARGLLGAAPNDPVCRQVASQSHPDLLVLERAVEDGKTKKFIAVDDARRMPEFFSKAPGSAPFRVAIIDSVDEMNINAANAVLKTLEEPPERGVIFLVSHAPGKLLPTIRSRCRRLTFASWSEERAAAFVIDRTGLDADRAARLAQMARGAPGRALALAQRGALEVDQTVADLLGNLPATDEAALLALADTFRGAEGAERFATVLERLAEQVRERALAAAAVRAGVAVDRWAALWERLTALPAEVDAVNLDRADAFWSVIADLKAAARL